MAKGTKSTMPGVLVGIYGVQGVGKSHVLKQIGSDRIEWRIADGSQLIREVMEERAQTMAHFDDMSPKGKASVRQAAVERAKSKPGVTLIAGHCSFPTKSGVGFDNVFTPADGEAYDMIVYLQKAPEKVMEQVKNDIQRARTEHSMEILQLWMDHEEKMLEEKCGEYGIVFDCFDGQNDYHDLIDLILERAMPSYLEASRAASEQALISTITSEVPEADVYLLIDGDGTLCPQDTGTLFFEQVDELKTVSDPLQKIFKRHDNYTFQGFLEAAMLYTKAVTESQYMSICQEIGREKVTLYKAWETFLEAIPSNVHPVIVSSSIREVWLNMVEAHGRSLERVSVVAGNNLLLHSYIVDNEAKGIVAKTLRRLHGGCRIISFGDSALDVPMLLESDRAYVVVNEKLNRSMKDFIDTELNLGRCKLGQLIDLDDSEDHVTRWHSGLPVQSLTLLSKELSSGSINSVIECTSTSIAAKIVAAKMRDANHYGPILQQIHEGAGEMLGEKLLDEFGQLMGLVENVDLPHVKGGDFQGLTTTKSSVIILPLMRGGEPMSRGVYSCFPSSALIHLYDGEQDFASKNELLAKVLAHSDSSKPVHIMLVDSVINSGKSIKRALSNIRKMAFEVDPKLNIILYVLTGVMQSDAAEQMPREFEFLRVRFIALRVSKNKYTGQGGSDTGNRLFGTTQVEN